MLAVGCEATGVTTHGIDAKVMQVETASPEFTSRYLGEASAAVYLIRPDQHIVARWSHFDKTAVARAILTATGKA